MAVGLKHLTEADEPWRVAAATALETVDRAALAAKVERLIEEVRQVARTERTGWGWSGGKDSQALRWIMEQAGVERSVLGVTYGLEFPALLRWFVQHMPDGCDLVELPAFDMRWLLANPEMIFPRSERGAYWFEVQRRTWKKFIKYERLTVLVLGRRKQDSNYIGPHGTDRYRDRDGVLRWSPLGTWTHEEVFALLAEHALPLPPCYEWPRGYYIGTGAWPARDVPRVETERDPARQRAIDLDVCFRECWEIDADMIRAAARDLPYAAAWMRTHEKE